MKINLLLCSPVVGVSKSNPGGIAIWFQNIINYNKRIDSDILIDVQSLDRKQYINENTMAIKRFFLGIVDYCRILKEIKRKIQNKKYDIIHVCTTASLSLIKDYIILKYAKKKGVQSVLHFHFGRIPDLSRHNNWEWKFLIKVVKIADKIIVIDHQSFVTLTEFGVKNVFEVPNPLSIDVNEEIEKNRNLSRVPHRILFASRGFRKKGIYELVEACSSIPNITLRMVGYFDKEDKEALLNIANNGNWIVFKGGVQHSEVIKELQSCDIFVLPTYTEGFPNAILESMATGTPTISTPVGAIPDMLDMNGDPCGICVPPKDVNSLRKAITLLIDNIALKENFSKKSIIRVNKLYSVPVVWNSLCYVWKS